MRLFLPLSKLEHRSHHRTHLMHHEGIRLHDIDKDLLAREEVIEEEIALEHVTYLRDTLILRRPESGKVMGAAYDGGVGVEQIEIRIGFDTVDSSIVKGG